MRINSVVVLLLLVPALVFARTSWLGDYEIVLDNVTDGRDVFAADFDGDGDDDLVVTARSAGISNVVLLVNIAGEFVPSVVDPNFTGATDAEAADIDGDGDIDIVVSGSSHIRWYRNDGGNSFTQLDVTGAFDDCLGLHVVDMDGDGDLDVAASSYVQDRVGWLENDGAGNFSNHVITYDCDGANDVNGADIDNDGDMDLVATSNVSARLLCYVNDGSMVFTEQVISDNHSSIRGLTTGDFQNDGLTDIAVAVNGADQYLIFSNNGDGSFTEVELESIAPGAWDVQMFDIDDDGDDDIFGYCQYDHDPRWFEYDDNNRYMEHTLDSDMLGFFGLTFGDFNGDCIPDAAAMRYSPDNLNEVLCWYGDRSEGWTERPVDSSIFGANDAKAADLDCDGEIDIVAAANSADKLFAYRNLGDNVYQEILIADFEGVYALHVTNMDNFDLPDILVASAFSNSVRLYRNFGNIEFVPIHIDSDLTQAQSVHGIDLDDDGDMDVLAGGHGDNDVVWYRQNDNGFYVKQTIDGDLIGVSDVVGVDFDRDGDKDVLACGQLEDCLVWYENDGAESFTRHNIVNGMNGVKAAVPSDLDGDGDFDVAGVLYTAGAVVWWENDGAMNFTTHVVASEFTQAFDIYVSDIDGDGSPDLAASSYGDDTLAWFQNDGACNFTMRVVDGDFEGPRGLHLHDMNDDGRLDLIAAANRESQVGWWQNLFAVQNDELTLTLEPNNEPIILPADGGTFNYWATIYRQGLDITIDAWTVITHVPTGNSLSPNCFSDLSISEGTHEYLQSQAIPPMAPGGNYTFGVYIGAYPWIVDVYDSFAFSKQEAVVTDYTVFDQPEHWPATGSLGESSESIVSTSRDSQLPAEYALGKAYPNPFNPTTTITVALPEAADLDVTVYNVTGQLVATLANGQTNAGTHSYVFDASGMASGLYFVRATIPGELSAVQKVMLVR